MQKMSVNCPLVCDLGRPTPSPSSYTDLPSNIDHLDIRPSDKYRHTSECSSMCYPFPLIDRADVLIGCELPTTCVRPSKMKPTEAGVEENCPCLASKSVLPLLWNIFLFHVHGFPAFSPTLCGQSLQAIDGPTVLFPSVFCLIRLFFFYRRGTFPDVSGGRQNTVFICSFRGIFICWR